MTNQTSRMEQIFSIRYMYVGAIVKIFRTRRLIAVTMNWMFCTRPISEINRAAWLMVKHESVIIPNV